MLKRHFKAKTFAVEQSILVSHVTINNFLQNGAKMINDTIQVLPLDPRASKLMQKCYAINIGSGTTPVATVESLVIMHENVVREG